MISKAKNRVNEFPPSLLDDLVNSCKSALDRGRAPIAAFDADGTLWDADIGESFFDFQIHRCGLPGLPEDPWRHYRELKLVDKPAAYAFLAQINVGIPLDQVRTWAQRAIIDRVDGLPVFESQLQLIERLRAIGIEIYVVTASVKWAVEPAAAAYSIDHDHVLGIETRLDARGTVSVDVVQPITWREGKAAALLKATGGRRPTFASGNTLGDVALLECATDVRLAISTQSEANELFEEEDKLWQTALERGWSTHAFHARPTRDR